jgi:hypothetical protein
MRYRQPDIIVTRHQGINQAGFSGTGRRGYDKQTSHHLSDLKDSCFETDNGVWLAC